MKRFFILLLSIVSFLSCSNEDNLSPYRWNESYLENQSTRCFDPDDCAVSAKDIDVYLNFKSLLPDYKDKSVIDIIPIPDEIHPSIYVINYNDSWEIISGDKRTPAVIASGSGKFDSQSVNESCQAWIECLAEQIEVLKTKQIETKYAVEYLDFWKAITADQDFINNNIAITRSGVDTTYHPGPGHYKLVAVFAYPEGTDSIAHLVKTKWGQDYPYNVYCPTDNSLAPYYDIIRCHAGCVPVAGGQIVNYFHQFGMTMPICDSAYVNTREYPYTDWANMLQWHWAESNWAKMNTADSSRISAILVANIGKGVTAEYHYYPYYAYNQNNQLVEYSGSTLARLEDLAGYLSQEYLPSNYAVFQDSSDYDYIYELLQDQYPSIVGAESYSGGPHSHHAFIVDRYMKARVDYYFCYQFFFDGVNHPSDISVLSYAYTAPEVIYFGMNWGFSGQNDDSWCLNSGNWYCGNVNYRTRISKVTFRDNLEGEEEPEEPIEIE